MSYADSLTGAFFSQTSIRDMNLTPGHYKGFKITIESGDNVGNSIICEYTGKHSNVAELADLWSFWSRPTITRVIMMASSCQLCLDNNPLLSLPTSSHMILVLMSRCCSL